MKTPNPESIHLQRQSERGFVYRNISFIPGPDKTPYTFTSYKIFRRAHSFSLGARGVVKVDKIPYDDRLSASVEIVKGLDPGCIRNMRNRFSRDYTYNQLVERYEDSAIPYSVEPLLWNIHEKTASAVARIAVADSIVAFSEQPSIASLLREAGMRADNPEW